MTMALAMRTTAQPEALRELRNRYLVATPNRPLLYPPGEA